MLSEMLARPVLYCQNVASTTALVPIVNLPMVPAVASVRFVWTEDDGVTRNRGDAGSSGNVRTVAVISDRVS